MRENLFVIFWLDGSIESWSCHTLESSEKNGFVKIKTSFEEDPDNWEGGKPLEPIEIPVRDLIAVQPYNA